LSDSGVERGLSFDLLFDGLLKAAAAGDVAVAEACLRQMDRGDNRFANASLHYSALLIRCRRYDEALAIIDERLSEWPNSVVALTQLGQIRHVQGLSGQALESYARAYKIKPDYGVLAELYAGALREAGRNKEAQGVMDAAVALRRTAIGKLARWRPRERSLAGDPLASARSLYLDLLEKTVSNWIYGDPSIMPGYEHGYERETRNRGKDWPMLGQSMIGLKRLRQLREAAETAITEGIEGDFLEAGVWRGGACILLRGVLAAYQEANRKVWVADSFEGLPPHDPRYEEDLHSLMDLNKYPQLAVSLSEVKDNFGSYDLLDDQVVFVKGLFKDTLPTLPPFKIAVLRLDGDMYSSTMDTFEALYDRVSPGGFVIVDDYGAIDDARRATIDFRLSRDIEEPMHAIDEDGVFWRRTDRMISQQFS
jgi:O-methyltransferase